VELDEEAIMRVKRSARRQLRMLLRVQEAYAEFH